MNTEANEAEAEAERAEEALDLADKIIHILEIYPVLSPTMLQMGIGPQVRAERWKPILEDLIAAGRVIREEQGATTPKGRFNTYTKLRLPNTEEMH